MTIATSDLFPKNLKLPLPKQIKFRHTFRANYINGHGAHNIAHRYGNLI